MRKILITMLRSSFYFKQEYTPIFLRRTEETLRCVEKNEVCEIIIHQQHNYRKKTYIYNEN